MGSRVLERCEEVLHVERKVIYSVVVGDRSNRSKVNPFLGGVRCNVSSDLLQVMEYGSAPDVFRRRPFFPSGVSQEQTSKEIEMHAVSAEAMSRFVLRELNGEVDVPACFP